MTIQFISHAERHVSKKRVCNIIRYQDISPKMKNPVASSGVSFNGESDLESLPPNPVCYSSLPQAASVPQSNPFSGLFRINPCAVTDEFVRHVTRELIELQQSFDLG